MFKHLIAIVAITFLLISSWLLFFYRADVACQFPPPSDFLASNSGIYFDNTLSDSEQQKVQQQLKQGKIRVENLFGITISTPKIIVVKQNHLAAKFEIRRDSNAIINPFSQCIVVKANAYVTDAYAHELVHTELAHRLGLYVSDEQFPSWFGEGLALMVDYRVQSGPTGQHLQSHETRTATLQVLNRIQPKTVYRRLERIRRGETFSQMFGQG